MADPITNAKLEQKRLEAEIEALRANLNKVEAFIEMYGVFAAGDSRRQPGASLSAPKTIGQPAPSSKKQTIPDRVAAILSAGLPRKPHVLLAMLEHEDGKPIGMGDEGRRITNLSSQLSRDKQRFKSNRAIGWSLVEQPRPQMKNPTSVSADVGLDDGFDLA